MTSAPFRAEVVGSPLRRARLCEARDEHAAGRRAELKGVEDAGVDLVTAPARREASP